MTVIALHDFANNADWQKKLQPYLDGFTLVDLMSEEGRLADIALVWARPPGWLAEMPNLKGIINKGQGVDHVMRDPTVPRQTPLVRLVDPDMSDALSHWAILAALDFWRDAGYYRQKQRQKIWKPIAQRPATGAAVGIMGVGAIGSVVARRFALLGFMVRGWARTSRMIDDVAVYAGADQFLDFLDGVDILVSVLPLTSETEGIMNADLFDRLAKGAFVINAGRGQQLVDADLITALDSGQISGAALDVFHQEPLPDTHPFWDHPAVTVWPHVAAQTNPDTAAKQVAAAISAIRAGLEPDNRVEWARGY